ncbi:hypothetical protein CHF27_013715 [Romboutsia maritimum]|uniref:Uncharacterized protein n=1 Tax=Romboutsia maritimum TaxID=2020948 RepID=A0A371IPI8_9FIRM|nr:hypothetical protein [Romboutsia maritimum]RDY22395.1 hypothetical protein CHF27_013715 [Romboutsia maritimum]
MNLKKYKSYTFAEYRMIQNEDLKIVDKMIAHIKKNKKNYKRLVILVAIVLLNDTSIIFADTNLAAIDTLGSKMLEVVRVVGYWYSVIMCSVESIKAAMNGTTNNITSIIFKYSLLFGTFYFVPTIFDMIKTVF